MRWSLALCVAIPLMLLAFSSSLAQGTQTYTSTTTVTYYVYTVSGLGKIKISTDGVVWVELSPITVTATYAHQKILINFLAEKIGNTTIVTTNIFGLNKTVASYLYRYNLILVNDCYAEPCYNVTFIPMHLNGSTIATVVLDGVQSKTTTITVPTNIVRVRYCLADECREVVGHAIEPIYVPPTIAPYIVLVPLAFFVALGVRGDLKVAAAGMAAYSFVAPILMNLLGIPIATSIALTALIFFLAILMMYVARR